MSPPEPSTNSHSQSGQDQDATHGEVTISKDPSVGWAPSSGAVNIKPGGDNDDVDGGRSQAKAAGEPAPSDTAADLIDVQDTNTTSSKRPMEDKGKQAAEDDGVEAMTSSMATLKPINVPLSNDAATSTTTQYLTAEPSTYVDPTPATPTASQPPSRSPSNAARSRHSDEHSSSSPSRSDPEYDEKRYTSEDDQEPGSQSEIQTIMAQFSEFGGGPGVDEVMSPRLEITSPVFGHPVQHPPRKSSLEPLIPSVSNHIQDLQRSPSASFGSLASPVSASAKDDHGPPVPPKDGAFGTPPRTKEDRSMSLASPSSPVQMHRPPPPEPEPEPVLPFDFHRFLEQLRNKKADPVARYLKSFLSEFGKRQWMVHEQVKIIGDFLAFIANKMAQCEVWRDVSDAEFDNAREGMEKLVMNRLYTQTFSPAIPPPKPIPGAKPKRRGGDAPLGPGRRGQHQEDVERDDIVTQKINIYGWVREEHLDIPPVGDSGRRFLKLAQQGW